MPLNDSTSLKVTNAVGSYFSGKTTVKLSSLPSSADYDYIVSRRMMKGSLMDTDRGSVSANKTLSALAIYGESHWYWETDEAAFLGGPTDTLTSSCTKERSGVEFPSTEIYTYRYTQTVSYNCLINESVPGLFSSSKDSTVLSSYADLCKEIRDNIKAGSEENGLSDAPGKDTPPGTPTVPTDTDDTSKDTAVTFSVTGSAPEINDGANVNPDTTRSLERALPWIIGVAVVAAIVAVVLIKTNKNKHR